MSLLGIDIGSGSCKGVVYTSEGHQLAKASQAYTPVRTGIAVVEMDPIVFRDAVFGVILQLSGQVQNDPVEALAISSHGETIIPVDDHGQALGYAIMNSDNRAVEEAQWWEKTFGIERIYEITGVPLHPMFSLNKIIWLKKNKPDLYAKTVKFLSVGDYLLMQMGFPALTDYSLASRTMAFDMRNRCWSQEILDHCGIPLEKLAVPVASGSVAGKLGAALAQTLGLREGTIVALGGHDQPCGALGAGAIKNGDVFDSAGTYECMAVVSDKPVNTAKALSFSLNSYCHVVPGKFVTLAFFPAGLVTTWFMEQFCYEDKLSALQSGSNLFDSMDDKVLKFCPHPTGLCITPHFVGSCTPSWDIRATGVMAGFTPGITRYHLYKGIFEGIACELLLNTTAVEAVMGSFDSMRIAGGNARSVYTVQLRADITGKAFHILKNEEAVCLGAAILAGIAAGIYKDAADAVKKVVQIEKTIQPDVAAQATYEKQVNQYKTLYPSLEPFRKV